MKKKNEKTPFIPLQIQAKIKIGAEKRGVYFGKGGGSEGFSDGKNAKFRKSLKRAALNSRPVRVCAYG